MIRSAPASDRGVSGYAVSFLATGGYLLLDGALFLSPFLLNPLARQNDVFMANLFLAPIYLIVGIILLVIGLVTGRHMRGRAWTQALVLAVGGAGLLALLYYAVGGRYYAFGETVSSLPPYLNLPVFAISVTLGGVVFLAGRLWGRV